MQSRLPAGRGARLRGGARSPARTSARGMPTASAQTFRAGRADGAVGMVVFALLAHIAPAAMIGIFSDDPAVIAVGRRVPADLVVELRRVGADLRHVSDVPGDGQHDSVAGHVVHPHRRWSPSRPSCCRDSRGFEMRWIWYLSVRRRRAADVHEPAHPAAGVPGSPRAGAGPLLIRGRLDRAPPGPGQRIIPAHPNLRTVFSRRGTGRISNR